MCRKAVIVIPFFLSCVFVVALSACGRSGYDEGERIIALNSDRDDCQERVTVCGQSYPVQCRTYCADGPDDCVTEQICVEAQSYPPRTICHDACESDLVPLPDCAEPVVGLDPNGEELIGCPTPDAIPGQPPAEECTQWEEVCVTPAIYPPVDPICSEVCVDGSDPAPPEGDPGVAGGTPE